MEWENGDTNYSIKKGGEWNGDATQTVTYQAGDDIHNSTPYDAASTPSRSSTQITANTTGPKDNSFSAVESDLFDEGYVLETIEPMNKCIKIDSLNLKVRVGRHWKNGFRFHAVPLVSTWLQEVQLIHPKNFAENFSKPEPR